MHEEPSGSTTDQGGQDRSALRIAGRVLLLMVLAVTVGWWVVGRMTADSRRLEVRRLAAEEVGRTSLDGSASRPRVESADSSRRVRVLTWNIAHGRGDVSYGLFRNFRGGDDETRRARLSRIAEVVRGADPDVVILNEVDFQAVWSGGMNQAEVLARATGFRIWVEQRNYDLQLPFAVLEFGNALLTSFPVDTTRWLGIPPHRWIEAVVMGAKAASVIRLDAPVGPLGVIPIHLEVRGSGTRRGAVAVLEGAREREPAPLLLAGDFNAAPPGWPQTGDLVDAADVEGTVLGALLERGWRSPRALGDPGPDAWTYPVPAPDRAIDWVLAEPPLEIVEARVLRGTEGLSDHAPVLAVVRVSDGEG